MTQQRMATTFCEYFLHAVCTSSHLFPREFDGTVPPHFYGEMSKTELGCQVLNEKGHFSEFSHFIRQHGLESEDHDLIMKLKSILWAVVCHSFRIVTPLSRIARAMLERQMEAFLFSRKKKLSPQSFKLPNSPLYHPSAG
jgi:hypothetical protein